MTSVKHAPHNWISTIAFRLFRRKMQSLSATYWTFQLGIHAVQERLQGVNGDKMVVHEIKPPFNLGMLPEDADTFLSGVDERCGIHRLHLLVVGMATLEAYRKDSIRLHVAGLGHANGIEKLDEVGKAIAAPVSRRSTVPSMVDYAGHLLGIDFQPVMPDLERAYKLRCAAAHNGGVATTRTLEEVTDLGIALGSVICLDWEHLRKYLKTIDRVASHVDSRVAKAPARYLEIEWLLHQLKKDKALPDKPKLWMWLAQAYGVPSMPVTKRREIERSVY